MFQFRCKASSAQLHGSTEAVAANVRRRSRTGSAMIEFCLLMPWYVFLFAGTFDFGFYSYALIATSNAARVGAAYCSASTTTCPNITYTCTNYVLTQLSYMPNIGTTVTSCTTSPATVSISYPTAATCPDTNSCVAVTVIYVTPHLVPIPGLFPGQLTITKTVQMRLSS
jgi:Flp pilus assembly protein TadG